MTKEDLFKKLKNANQRNWFSIAISQNNIEDEENIKRLARELESEGKIKIRDCIKVDDCIHLEGILKYAPN